YRLLPTVSDFMAVREVATGDGTADIEIIEKELDDARLKELMHHGRGRLLHPKGELAAMGHPWEEGHHSPDSTMVPEGTKPLLEVRDLKVHFPIRRGVLSRVVGHVKAVDGVSFKVYKGQTLGLVGESGCGKTTTGRAILRLVDATAGDVLFEGRNVLDLGSRELRAMRRRMQIIFQDPYGSLNPR